MTEAERIDNILLPCVTLFSIVLVRNIILLLLCTYCMLCFT